MGSSPFNWKASLSVGADGENTVMLWLRARGWEIEDVTNDRNYQRRDIDFICNGRTTEVKTDTHTTGNFYLEIGSQKAPGCVFKSRAEVLAYWFIHLGELWFIRLPALQYWLMVHGQEYPRKVVRSTALGSRYVYATAGIAVPSGILEDAGVAIRIEMKEGDTNEQQREQTNTSA